jgi:hemolysin activation/secretion protein
LLARFLHENVQISNTSDTGMENTYQRQIAKIIGVAVALASQLAFAQTAPDAGSLLRQAEKELPQKPLSFALPNRIVPVIKVQPGESTVTVSRFEFAGNKTLSTDQLRQVVAAYIDRPLTFAELQQAADAVTIAYQEAGWVVRAYLPRQNISQGVVIIQVTEAVYGKSYLSGIEPLRISVQRLIDMMAAAQQPGQPMSARSVDRALLLMDDLPGVSVGGNMMEGAQSGETDVILSVTDEPLLMGTVSADNNGSRSTGTQRLSGNMSLNSPMRFGDALALNLLKTQGSDYLRFAYSLPLGLDGFRGGVQISQMRYELLGEFASLQGKGTADTAGFNLSYPWLRSQFTNINAALNYDAKKFDNVNSSGPQSNYKVNVAAMSLNLSDIDHFAGGGANNASVTLTSGRVNLDGSANQNTDTTGAHTQAGYQKLNLGVSRTQTLTSELSLYVSANVQTASKNLDSSEKIYLGGASGVRAYPSSEGGGSEGKTLTAELRQKLSPQATLTGFYDLGQAKAFNDNNKVDGSGLNSGIAPNSYTLKGYGMSASWQPEKNIDLKATLARRIGESPIASPSTGMDGDGSKKINRVWLSASVSF